MSVLIVAPPSDMHAVCVAHAIREGLGTECVLWDSGSLPAESAATYSPGPLGRLRVAVREGMSFDLDAFTSIWWRRPAKEQRIDEAVTDDRVRQYCRDEARRFFMGMVSCTNTPILNDPDRQARAARKPFQLRIAAEVGLRIPRTVMTNDPDVVRDFCSSTESAVYKAFQSPSWQMVETRRLVEDDLRRLDSLRHAPVIVQECIELGRDLRVTVVGDEIFAAGTVTACSAAEVDWRVELTARWQPVTLDADVSGRIIALMRRLGLDYGCLDLREDRAGEMFFLEVNPSGQFLFVEIDTGQPIVRAIAEMLCSGQ